MKKLIVSFFLLGILIPFLPFNSAASGSPDIDDIDVEITYVFDEDNPEVEADMDDQAYGSTIEPTPVSQSGYTFKYWVVNGVVRDDLPENHSFYVTSSLNLIGVYSPDDENVVLFIDSNGKIIDTQFVADQGTAVAPTNDLPTKPGLQIATPAWVNKLTGTSDLTITDDSIFVLQYESASSDTFELTVDGVLEDTYDFNEVVTLTAAANDGANDFSHWEENGIVVSRDLEYSFTMLSERSLDKVYLASPEADEALVSMTNDLTLRDGYQTYMGQFYLPSGADLVEYGFLIHSDNTLDLTLETEGVTIAKSNNYNSATNEFLTSFPVESHMNVRAYVVMTTGSGTLPSYSEKILRYLNENELVYSTGFESDDGFTARTNYQGTHEAEGISPETWTFFFGTPSTTGAISENQSAQMRYYTSTGNEGNIPYIESNFTFDQVSKITFKALNQSGNNLSVSTSTDGITWSNSQSFDLTTSAEDYVYEKGTFENVYIRFELVPPASPSNAKRVTIDDLKVYRSYSGLANLVILNDEGSTEKVIVRENGYLSDEYNPTKEGYTFDGWYLEDTFSTPFDIETDTVTSDITLYAKWNIETTYVETFNSWGLTGSYTEELTSVTGANNISWQHIGGRNEGGYAIDGATILFRSKDSKWSPLMQSGTISGGISAFSIDMRKGFTGGSNNRQIRVTITPSIGDPVVRTSQTFGTSSTDTTVYNFSFDDFTPITGNFTILIEILGAQTSLDNLSWTVNPE